jgi:hypothetical protein
MFRPSWVDLKTSKGHSRPLLPKSASQPLVPDSSLAHPSEEEGPRRGRSCHLPQQGPRAGTADKMLSYFMNNIKQHYRQELRRKAASKERRAGQQGYFRS